MLKRLELIGFKSFAEKTQFDFGEGITAVVGPNGSGKSNVVDAVRWILGEQSAKSLRGGEMADVIFNGSSSRRSLGMAEVTLTLDNSRRRLSLDADEVQVTRRVYRSGEGEYLINKQPSRLRDIKEMFLGSGAGSDAYSIIEQGRVDVLLQASTRDRRGIFEEAAGISRFKGKRIETQRKLERVEQNLLRLRDIIEEVDRQLRSVKLQASKAQRFREHTERLKELRVAISLGEYHQLSGQSVALVGVIDALKAGLAIQQNQTRQWEEELTRLQDESDRLEGRLRREEAALAGARQRIASEETTLQHERGQTSNLEKDLTATRDQSQGLQSKLNAMAGIVDRHALELAAVETECHEKNEQVESLEENLSAILARFADVRERVQADKNETMEQLRLAGKRHNEHVSFKAQADSLIHHRQRLENKTTQSAHSLTELDAEVQTLAEAESKLQDQLAESRRRLAESQAQREQLRLAAERGALELAEFRELRSGLASRIQVLENLERSLEGLSLGVREALELARNAGTGPWQTVIGLVADLLTVRREYAPLIDIALGDRSQCLLIRDPNQLADALHRHSGEFTGRVGFMPVPSGVADSVTNDAITRYPGFVAWASDLVTCNLPELVDLSRHLLGLTVVVKDLAVARELAATVPGMRFISLQGEMLDADGVLTVGTHHGESGILSRKSELRDLRLQAVELDSVITAKESLRSELREQAGALESREQELQRETQALGEQSNDLHTRLAQQRQRHEGLTQEVELSHTELRQIDADLTTLQEAQRTTHEQARIADARVQELQARLEREEKEIRSLELERHQSQQAGTAAKVELAKAEERRAALAMRHRQAQHDWRHRQAEQQQLDDQLATLAKRLRISMQTLLRASGTLSLAYVEKESAEGRILQLADEVARVRGERYRHQEQAQAAREALANLQEQFHARELETSDLQHKLAHLTDRLLEEHELDLRELYRDYQPPEPALDAVAVQEEIAELKRKIGRLGSVSLDAIQELQELEQRSMTLQTQHDDLAAAKKSLDDIIEKINHDSRRLFQESFTAICGHFQELFRKLFGGGMADIVLENPEDVLESGIEIVARPPGKELRSISLMSGGEKTLTAVALLLAIFRSKPSPFCILDEVDAALDEANIGRFTAVLREFLDQSQFIIITHSKKTMAMADVLYGVTMQESGVSKRVAVRFEDWPEDDESETASRTLESANGDSLIEPAEHAA